MSEYDELEQFEQGSEQDEDQDEQAVETAESGTDSDEAEADDGEAKAAAPRRRASAKVAARADESGEHTIAARQALRDEMDRQIQEFLARGGKISQIAPEVTADPPRKPSSDYGSST